MLTNTKFFHAISFPSYSANVTHSLFALISSWIVCLSLFALFRLNAKSIYWLLLNSALQQLIALSMWLGTGEWKYACHEIHSPHVRFQSTAWPERSVYTSSSLRSSRWHDSVWQCNVQTTEQLCSMCNVLLSPGVSLTVLLRTHSLLAPLSCIFPSLSPQRCSSYVVSPSSLAQCRPLLHSLWASCYIVEV